MTKAVIFDLDGTLLDTLDDLTAAVNFCMRKYGAPEHDRESIRKKVGTGIYNLVAQALPEGREHPEFENIMRDYSAYYRAHMTDLTKPYAGITEMLKNLKAAGVRMAIVSNKFDAATKDLNSKYFDGLIEVAIGEAEKRGIRKKPAPDSVIEAMKELNVNKEDCIYAGDSDVDIETAKNAGIPCVSVTWGFRTEEFLKEHGAKIIAYSPKELYEIAIDKYK